MLQRCPTCECMFDPAGVKSVPFCSPRCRKIDLGRWLNESIGIPLARDAEDDQEESEVAEGWFDEPDED